MAMRSRCIGWSGDIFQLNSENGNKWEFVLPDSGGTLWSDNMMIPIGSPHKKNAETLINYYYDPKVAAEVAAYVNFICPVQGAKEEMQKIDPDARQEPADLPDRRGPGESQVFTKPRRPPRRRGTTSVPAGDRER